MHTKAQRLSDESVANITVGAKKRTGKRECSNYHKIVEYRNASCLCSECQGKISKENVNNLKESGICYVLACGKYNLSRDKNGRGRDVDYGDGELVANRDIIDKSTNKIIVYKCQKCGCNCSQKWYTEHNNEDAMIEDLKSNFNKLNERYVKFCDNYGEETVHDGFGTCLICNSNTGSIKKLIEKDNVLLYWDSTIRKYVNCEVYIKTFKK